MSHHSPLRKLGSEWLDCVDKTREANCDKGTHLQPVGRVLSGDGSWETILEENALPQASAAAAPAQEMGVAIDVGSGYEADVEYEVGTSAQHQDEAEKGRGRDEIGKRLRCCGFVQFLTWSFGDLRPFFVKLNYTEVGSGRWLSDHGLVALRLGLLMLNAISAGLAFGLRDLVQVKFLASELFTWLHLFVIVPMLCLLMGSLLKLRGDLENAQGPTPRISWAVLGICVQTLNTLSQAELLRLIVLHLVPSLQPSSIEKGAEELYSFSSPFAIQRYVLFITGTAELLFSRVPHRPSYVFIAILISIVWGVSFYNMRASSAASGFRLSFLLGGIFTVFKLSLMNTFIHRRLMFFSDGVPEVPEEHNVV